MKSLQGLQKLLSGRLKAHNLRDGMMQSDGKNNIFGIVLMKEFLKPKQQSGLTGGADVNPMLLTPYKSIYLVHSLSDLIKKFLFISYNNTQMKTKLFFSQFAFGRKHGAVEQIHWLTPEICCFLEDGNYNLPVFLDDAQAFDKVCHQRKVSFELISPTGGYLLNKKRFSLRESIKLE